MKFHWQFFFFVSFIGVFAKTANGRSASKLPSYIHPCKKTDPKLNECLKKFFESVQSRFTTGIPEIGLQVMDPLSIEKMNIKLPGRATNKMDFFDAQISGLKDMKIQEVSFQPDKLEMKFKAAIPLLTAEGKYDVDAFLMNSKLKGKGPFRANATDVVTDSTIVGKIIEKNGEKVLHFIDADGNATYKKYHIAIENLFPDKKANQGFNNLINSPAGKSMANAQMPVLKKVASETILQYVNQIVERIPYNSIIM